MMFDIIIFSIQNINCLNVNLSRKIDVFIVISNIYLILKIYRNII